MDGKTLDGFASSKAAALLAYLSVEHGRAHAREALAALLWPDHDAERARQNLRQLIATIRRTLGEVADLVLFGDRETLRFVASPAAAVDAHAFDLPGAEADDRVAGVHRGPFLASLPSIESDPWQDWLRARRQAFDLRAVEALRRRVDRALVERSAHAAISDAQRLLAIDPWSEGGHRGLMRALALAGQRNAAIAHYHKCRTLLATELGIAPEPETSALFEAIKAGAVQAQSGASATGERRHVSALRIQTFVAFGAGPDEVAPLPLGLAAVIERNGGILAVLETDRLLAYFGWGGQRDGGARQAVAAGLEALALSQGLRAAVHTGVALVAPGQDRVGGNLASAVRALVEAAGPGCLLADEATRQRADGHFVWRETALPALPVFGGTANAWLAVEAAGTRPRAEAAVRPRPSPLVGRADELRRIEEGWAKVRLGAAATFLIEGEAGIGKSRLVREAVERFDGEAEWYRHDCLPQYAHVAFHPLTIFAARGLKLPGDPGRDAPRRPLLLVVEDVQWCDRASLDVLACLGGPVLVLATARRGTGPQGWAQAFGGAERIDLGPLGAGSTAELVAAALPDTAPGSVVRAIAERSAGVPLLAEELSQASRAGTVVASGAFGDLVLARLDLLPAGKAAALLGAVIGLEFSLDLLRAAAARLEMPVAEIVRGLAGLVESGLLESRREPGNTFYRFRHGMVHEAIYGAQPQAALRRRHGAVAAVMQADPRLDRGGRHAAVVAWHLERAGRSSDALAWWVAAAEDAQAKGASDIAADIARRHLGQDASA
ncbi:MAG: BTAD domain-containing putative transcriptional regulator [Actinomycetota bacterium]